MRRGMFLRNDRLFLSLIMLLCVILVTFKIVEFEAHKTYHNIHLKVNVVTKQSEEMRQIRETYEQSRTLSTDLKFTSKNYKLLILSFERNELDKLLDNLNNFDNIIYWREPMRVWERINKHWRSNDLSILESDPLVNFEMNTIEKFYETYNNTEEFLQELYSCNFSPKIDVFLQTAAKICPEYLISSQLLSRLLRCTEAKNKIDCTATGGIARRLNRICKERHKNVIVKINEERLYDFKSVYLKLKRATQHQLNVLHILQDPRSVTYDLTQNSRVPRNPYRDDFQTILRYMCEQGEKNFDFTKELTKQSNFLQVHFENLRINFTTKILRDTLNMNFDRKEFQNVAQIQEGDVWRRQMSFEIFSEVESLCWNLLSKLKYKIIDGYDDKQLRDGSSLLEV